MTSVIVSLRSGVVRSQRRRGDVPGGDIESLEGWKRVKNPTSASSMTLTAGRLERVACSRSTFRLLPGPSDQFAVGARDQLAGSLVFAQLRKASPDRACPCCPIERRGNRVKTLPAGLQF
jgi:hypothetical protein